MVKKTLIGKNRRLRFQFSRRNGLYVGLAFILSENGTVMVNRSCMSRAREKHHAHP